MNYIKVCKVTIAAAAFSTIYLYANAESETSKDTSIRCAAHNLFMNSLFQVVVNEVKVGDQFKREFKSITGSDPEVEKYLEHFQRFTNIAAIISAESNNADTNDYFDLVNQEIREKTNATISEHLNADIFEESARLELITGAHRDQLLCAATLFTDPNISSVNRSLE